MQVAKLYRSEIVQLAKKMGAVNRVFVIGDTSFRSPQKICNSIVYRGRASQNYFIPFWKQNH